MITKKQAKEAMEKRANGETVIPNLNLDQKIAEQKFLMNLPYNETDEKIKYFVMLKQANNINTIKNCASFVAVAVAIGLAIQLIGAFASLAH